MKKVCFISLSRSDYASLKPIIQASLKHAQFETSVIAGGSHLLKRFGASIGQFHMDGIPISHIVDFMLDSDNSEQDIARAYGRAYQQFVDTYDNLKPDYIFILGDRWEILAAAQAASFMRLPIIHHSGGDLTQGSLDNQTRYILTNLSHFHLTAVDEHKRRIEAIGEEPWRVTVVGEPALTGIKGKATNASVIRRLFGLRKREKFVLATFHPTTFDSASFEDQVSIYIKALRLIDDKVILTAPNPDAGSKVFLDELTKFASTHQNILLFENLGADRYYGAMSEADYMIGNSSSGIWEAPSFKLPVINIGERQRDRIRANNVIDTPLSETAIKESLSLIKQRSFRDSIEKVTNPYVKDNTIELILEGITFALDCKKVLLAKKLIDPIRSNT